MTQSIFYINKDFASILLLKFYLILPKKILKRFENLQIKISSASSSYKEKSISIKKNKISILTN